MTKSSFKAAKKIKAGQAVVLNKDGTIKPVVKNKTIKYDFDALKNEFFISEFDEVTAFFQYKFSIYNGHIADKTIGWASDKKEWKRKVALAANKQTFDNEVRVKANALKRVLKSFLHDFEDHEALCPKCGGSGKDLMKEDQPACRPCKGEGVVLYRFEDLPPKIRQIHWQIFRIENNLPVSLSKFQQLPGPVGETPLSSHTRKILQDNGIDPAEVMD